MADPRAPDGEALWARVIATVRPLKGRRAVRTTPRPMSASPPPAPPPPASLVAAPAAAPTPRMAQQGARATNTLDGAWDKRLTRGLATPDWTIDLHGFTLAAAHAELEAGLARAIAQGARLVLLVTGRPPPPGRSRLDDPLRGRIRASIGDWLDHSSHAARIAAVRGAHPRHGGAGALYVVLRRAR